VLKQRAIAFDGLVLLVIATCRTLDEIRWFAPDHSG